MSEKNIVNGYVDQFQIIINIRYDDTRRMHC